MNPTNTTVRHTPLSKNRAPEGAATLDKVCAAGAQCAQVQGDPLCKQALTVLQGKTTTLHASVSTKEQAAQTLLAAAKVMGIDLADAGEALVNYEGAVRTVAAGDGSIINAAGLLSRPVKTPEAALAVVENVTGKKGKESAQGIVHWPATAGATSYALQVNFTPQTAGSPYTALGSGTRRNRVVKAPAPGAQFLAQVAAIASDGTQSAWSDAILVTAR
jgi:hypothetical protein